MKIMTISNSRVHVAGPLVFLAITVCSFAQQSPVPMPRHAQGHAIAQQAVLSPAPAPPAGVTPGPVSKLSVTVEDTVPGVAYVGHLTYVTVTAVDNNGFAVPNYTGKITIQSSDKDAFIADSAPVTGGQWKFGIAFRNKGNQTVTAFDNASPGTIKGEVNVRVSDPVNHYCDWFPIRQGCVSSYDDINAFYSTASNVSYFKQVKSIYNGASSSATVSADIASLNFSNGMQVTAGTNIQAGSSGFSSFIADCRSASDAPARRGQRKRHRICSMEARWLYRRCIPCSDTG